jgi:hypothetical protein
MAAYNQGPHGFAPLAWTSAKAAGRMTQRLSLAPAQPRAPDTQPAQMVRHCTVDGARAVQNEAPLARHGAASLMAGVRFDEAQRGRSRSEVKRARPRRGEGVVRMFLNRNFSSPGSIGEFASAALDLVPSPAKVAWSGYVECIRRTLH